jgi:hypothetical protein
MKFITEYWSILAAVAAVTAVGGYTVYTFFKMPSDKQTNKVQEWLLYAVTKAETELGAGTGEIKLRYTYDMFVTKFEWIAKTITFEMFSGMVDVALTQMKEILENNKAVQKLVDEKKMGETQWD